MYIGLPIANLPTANLPIAILELPNCSNHGRLTLLKRCYCLESLYDNFNFSTLISCHSKTRTSVAWELMRVDKRDFVWEFSQLSRLGQRRTRVAWELMRVDTRFFVLKFSQLSCLAQTSCMRANESWQARVCKSFLNSHGLVQTRTRVVWKLTRVCKQETLKFTSESLCDCLFKLHVQVKRTRLYKGGEFQGSL